MSAERQYDSVIVELEKTRSRVVTLESKISTDSEPAKTGADIKNSNGDPVHVVI